MNTTDNLTAAGTTDPAPRHSPVTQIPGGFRILIDESSAGTAGAFLLDNPIETVRLQRVNGVKASAETH